MPAIITDTFDYDDIVRVLDLDEAFVHHQIDALQLADGYAKDGGDEGLDHE